MDRFNSNTRGQYNQRRHVQYKPKYINEFNTTLHRTVYYNPDKSLQISPSKHPIDTTEQPLLFRILTPEMKQEKYVSRKKEIITALHWGQRKLLLTEIEFLTNYLSDNTYLKKNTYVIYAGSAPGTHIEYLSKLFPDMYFMLYDPRQFSPKLNKNPYINTYEQFFTDDTAKEWISDKHPDKNILFISDIRTGSTDMEIKDFEMCVKLDNENQMSWYNIINPKKSMFKFRLPYDSDEITQYLNGQVFLQPYAPTTSTETRLIVDEKAKIKSYDDRIYEEQMFYFNKHTRNQTYDNLLTNEAEKNKNGISNNFDGASEVCILEKYLNYIGLSKISDIKSRIIEMVGEISMELSSSRTLYSEQPLNDKKKNMLSNLKNKNYIPKNIQLNQKTFNKYVIPNYDKFEKLGLI
jgi:cap2 methyltransferase